MHNAILVVDDDPGLRQMMQWALQDGGYEVDTAADGFAAVAKIRAALPRLLVLDMTLPGIDGIGVADVLRSASADTPIVVVTADADAEGKANRVGARAYLRKPLSMADLLAMVRKVLGSR